MKLTKFSEYYELVTNHNYFTNYQTQLDYLKKLELGIESGNDAIILLCSIGQMKIAEELLN